MSRAELDELIRYHQDSLYSSRWQMAPRTEQIETRTVKVLRHYRRLCAIIDQEEEPEVSPGPTPGLPPLETPPGQEPS